MFLFDIMPAAIAWLVLVASGITAGGVIWTQGVRKVWRGIKRGEQISEDVKSIAPLRDDVKEIHSKLDEFIASMAEFKDHTMHELSHNSGKSIKDVVVETRDKLDEHINNNSLHNQ
jgi:hypothetical protein